MSMCQGSLTQSENGYLCLAQELDSSSSGRDVKEKPLCQKHLGAFGRKCSGVASSTSCLECSLLNMRIPAHHLICPRLPLHYDVGALPTLPDAVPASFQISFILATPLEAR